VMSCGSTGIGKGDRAGVSSVMTAVPSPRSSSTSIISEAAIGSLDMAGHGIGVFVGDDKGYLKDGRRWEGDSWPMGNSSQPGECTVRLRQDEMERKGREGKDDDAHKASIDSEPTDRLLAILR
jgi:hypothetical protein